MFRSKDGKLSGAGDDIFDELEDDEKELDRIDRFESKYNFRFEELQDEANRQDEDENDDDDDDDDVNYAATKKNTLANSSSLASSSSSSGQASSL